LDECVVHLYPCFYEEELENVHPGNFDELEFIALFDVIELYQLSDEIGLEVVEAGDEFVFGEVGFDVLLWELAEGGDLLGVEYSRGVPLYFLLAVELLEFLHARLGEEYHLFGLL
jgi:hypothetical protein